MSSNRSGTHGRARCSSHRPCNHCKQSPLIINVLTSGIIPRTSRTPLRSLEKTETSKRTNRRKMWLSSGWSTKNVHSFSVMLPARRGQDRGETLRTEVTEIERAVFRALTRLRAATIMEFEMIARLETQAIDAYNDAHQYRGGDSWTHDPEIPQVQYIDKIVDMPIVTQRQVPTIQMMQESVEVPQVQFLDRVVDVPVVMQRQVSCPSQRSNSGVHY